MWLEKCCKNCLNFAWFHHPLSSLMFLLCDIVDLISRVKCHRKINFITERSRESLKDSRRWFWSWWSNYSWRWWWNWSWELLTTFCHWMVWMQMKYFVVKVDANIKNQMSVIISPLHLHQIIRGLSTWHWYLRSRKVQRLLILHGTSNFAGQWL